MWTTPYFLVSNIPLILEANEIWDYQLCYELNCAPPPHQIYMLTIHMQKNSEWTVFGLVCVCVANGFSFFKLQFTFSIVCISFRCTA